MAAPLPDGVRDALELAVDKAAVMVEAAEDVPDGALPGTGDAKLAALANAARAAFEGAAALEKGALEAWWAQHKAENKASGKLSGRLGESRDPLARRLVSLRRGRQGSGAGGGNGPVLTAEAAHHFMLDADDKANLTTYRFRAAAALTNAVAPEGPSGIHLRNHPKKNLYDAASLWNQVGMACGGLLLRDYVEGPADAGRAALQIVGYPRQRREPRGYLPVREAEDEDARKRVRTLLGRPRGGSAGGAGGSPP